MIHLDIKFSVGHSFVGASYSMNVNGKEYCFGFETEDNVKDNIKTILSNEYDYEIDVDDIDFEWDGTM